MRKLLVPASLAALFACVAAPAAAGVADIIRCDSEAEGDINRVANFIDDNWSDFEQFLEDATGMNIKKCMKNRFQKNGKVECESSCDPFHSKAVAWASAFNKRIHICPSFFDNIDDIARTPDRRACWAAIMTHEFAHSCDRLREKGADALDEAAFDFWADTHTVTIDKQNDCGFD